MQRWLVTHNSFSGKSHGFQAVDIFHDGKATSLLKKQCSEILSGCSFQQNKGDPNIFQSETVRNMDSNPVGYCFTAPMWQPRQRCPSCNASTCFWWYNWKSTSLPASNAVELFQGRRRPLGPCVSPRAALHFARGAWRFSSAQRRLDPTEPAATVARETQ